MKFRLIFEFEMINTEEVLTKLEDLKKCISDEINIDKNKIDYFIKKEEMKNAH